MSGIGKWFVIRWGNLFRLNVHFDLTEVDNGRRTGRITFGHKSEVFGRPVGAASCGTIRLGVSSASAEYARATLSELVPMPASKAASTPGRSYP